MGCSSSSGDSPEPEFPPAPTPTKERQEHVASFYGMASLDTSDMDFKCSLGCGRFKYGKFETCCAHCSGPEGPHTEDCGQKGLCAEGCGRRAFVGTDGKVLKTCCKSCAFLHQNKGFCGHDIACDVRHNGGTATPFYWQSHKKQQEEFHEEVGGEYVRKMATKLIQRTLPESVVVQSLRVEDSKLWQKYTAKRREIRHRAVTIEDIKPMTSEDLEFSANTTLDHVVNEMWLFHGTSLAAAEAIAKSNFTLPNSPGLFGKGLYFAEASKKSDQYAKTIEEGEHAGCRIVLLCRVTLGNMRHLKMAETEAEKLVRDPNIDSVLGFATGSLREFLVYDAAQVYPEYILYYKKGA